MTYLSNTSSSTSPVVRTNSLLQTTRIHVPLSPFAGEDNNHNIHFIVRFLSKLSFIGLGLLLSGNNTHSHSLLFTLVVYQHVCLSLCLACYVGKHFEYAYLEMISSASTKLRPQLAKVLLYWFLSTEM